MAAGLGAVAIFGRDRWRRGRVLRRLETLAAESAPRAEATVSHRTAQGSLVRSRAALPWIAAAGIGAALLAGGIRSEFALAGAFALGALGAMAERNHRAKLALRLESQLADSVDLLIGSLRAGSGLVDALERASQTAQEPLAAVLAETAARFRLGERPQEVLRELSVRVPLEAFRLFSFALSVHWEAGGSLAPTLATVGRSVRDRVDVSRRIRSQSAPTAASIASLLGASHAIAWLAFARDPVNFERFLATPAGGALAAATVALQALGLLWIARWSEVRL